MNDFDVEIMARTAVGEARGEGDDGMLAVMWTGLNRYTAKRWYSARTIAGTFLKHSQYSCWLGLDPNYELIINIDADTPLYTKAMVMAANVLRGSEPDITEGCTHYKRVGTLASWAEGKTPVKVIGNHEFYAGIP